MVGHGHGWPWQATACHGRSDTVAQNPKQALTGLHIDTGERSFSQLSKNAEVDAKCDGSAMTTNYSKMNLTARVNCRAGKVQNRVMLNRLCNTVQQNIIGCSALVMFYANSGTTYIRSFTKRDRNLEDQALLDCDLKCGILMF